MLFDKLITKTTTTADSGVKRPGISSVATLKELIWSFTISIDYDNK